MQKSLIKKIQNRVINLLKSKRNKSLHILAKDNCSELSRLVGCWILTEKPKSRISILKGKGISNKKDLCHDILAIEECKKIYLIDPSIWQFFKYKRSILVGQTENMKDSLMFVEKFYKGKWKVSEILKKNSCNEKDKTKWEKIIRLNIQN